MVKVRNTGAYVAQVFVYYVNGGKNQVYSSGSFYANQVKSVVIPAYSSNIHILVQNMVFIASWKNVLYTDVPLYKDFCVSIGGTTLIPTRAFC